MIFSSFDIFFLKKEVEKLVGLLHIRPGFAIAEIGAGSGSLSLYLAQFVGADGLVFATEFEQKKVDAIVRKAQKSGLSNLQTALAGRDDPHLPQKQFDLILGSKVYHHFTNSAAQNASFYKHLKPEGQLAVIDFEPKWYLKLSTPKGVPKSYGGHGIFKEVLVREVERAGFSLKQLVERFSAGGLFLAIFNKNSS